MSKSTTAYTYICYGCADIVNDARTYAYYQWACATDKWQCDQRPEAVDPCYCDLDGLPADYTDPATDGVCWYDPLIPESADFLGVLVSKIPNARDSTYTRQVSPSFNEGDILERPQKSGKSFAMEVVLLATSCAGMEYGLEWFRKVTENEVCTGQDRCSRCTGQEMRMRVYCDASLDTDRGLRDWVTVGTVDGLELVDEDSKACCCIRRGRLTMHSEEPYNFSSREEILAVDADIESPVTSCTDWDSFCVDCQSSLCVECQNCAQPDEFCAACRAQCGACDRCTYDFVCTDNNFEIVTPVFVEQENCFCTPFSRVVQCVSSNDIPDSVATTLRLELYSGDSPDAAFREAGLRNVRLKAWTNPLGIAPPTDLETYNEWEQRARCFSLDISYIPSNSRLIIDGRTQRVTLECDKSCIPYEHVVTASLGGPVFPLDFRCSGFLLCVEWDELHTQFDNTDGNIPSSLQVSSFLKWRN